MSTLTFEIVSVICGGKGPKFPPRQSRNREFHKHVTLVDNRSNKRTPCQVYQAALEASKADVLIYIHDDVTIHDADWLGRVLDQFGEHTAAVGLGGATSLGHPNLYKVPYKLQDMARGGYASNQTDWQVHGTQETEARRVAVLDAFFMAVRRDFLLEIGGWPTGYLTHHCLDLWLACEAARHGKDTRIVGASCTHHGGQTSVKALYQDAKWLQGGDTDEDHKRPHFWLYVAYRDVLPLRV